MSITASEMTPADIAAVTNNNGNNCNDGWGGGWSSWIILFLIFGMFGWGGFGGFGGFGGGWGGNNAAMQGALTRGDLCMDMNFNDLQNGVRNINDAVNTGFANLNSTICHQQYDTAMLVNGVNTNLSNGFAGLNNAVCTLGYQNAQLINGVDNTIQQGFNAANVVALTNQNALQTQLADCCCKNQTGQMQLGNSMERGFCDINYAQATNTNAIIQNAHSDTDRILARIDAFERNQDKEKIAQQAAEIQAYKQNAAFGAMIDASRAEILHRTGAECPTAAYIVQPPQPVSFNTNCNGQATFGNNCGCGNGCGNCGF